MLTIRHDRSNNCNHTRATVRGDRQNPLGIQSSTDQMGQQEFPGLLGFPLALDKTQELPFSLLSNPDCTQGGLSAQTFLTDFEVGTFNDHIRYGLGDGPIQPVGQLFSDPLVHAANLRQADFLSPQEARNLAHFPGGNASPKHLRNDFFDPLVLPPVAGLDPAVEDTGFSPPGQRQVIDQTETGFQLFSPMPVALVPAVIGYVQSFWRRYNARIHLQRRFAASPLRETPTPQLDVVQKGAKVFKMTPGSWADSLILWA